MEGNELKLAEVIELIPIDIVVLRWVVLQNQDVKLTLRESTDVHHVLREQIPDMIVFLQVFAGRPHGPPPDPNSRRYFNQL